MTFYWDGQTKRRQGVPADKDFINVHRQLVVVRLQYRKAVLKETPMILPQALAAITKMKMTRIDRFGDANALQIWRCL